MPASDGSSIATQSPRTYTKLTIAIIITALIVGSIAYLVILPVSKTVAVTTVLTSTTTSTGTTTTTVTAAASTLTASCDASSTLHCVVFQQTGACSPEFWGVPWSVTIGGTTGVQPPGTPLPLDNYSLLGTSNQNLTVIVFSLPDGSYPFRVSPDSFFTPVSGIVHVNGTDALIQIGYTGTSCVSTTSSNTSPDPVTLAESAGDWNFSVQLNATAIATGQEINYTCYLTNTSNQTQTIIVAFPLSNPTIYTQGGQQVWTSAGSATNAAQNVSAGQTLTYRVTIPTSELQAGHTYLLNGYPNVSTDANPEAFFGQQLQVNATITVG